MCTMFLTNQMMGNLKSKYRSKYKMSNEINNKNEKCKYTEWSLISTVYLNGDLQLQKLLSSKLIIHLPP